MVLEQKILDAQESRRKRVTLLVCSFLAISLLCASVVFYISYRPISPPVVSPDIPSNDLAVVPTNNNIESSQSIPNEELRSSYISKLNNYESNIKPDLNKTDLAKWEPERDAQLEATEDQALSQFSAANYAEAHNAIETATQLAQALITDSQLAFSQAMTDAQLTYGKDNYDEAKLQITKAQMFDNTSVEASTLAAEIERLPEILALTEQINTANIENQFEKELKLINEMMTLAPERTAVVERKQELINILAQRNFQSYIAQSYQAIKQSDVSKAKQKISAAKKVFPNRQEIQSVETAIRQLEKKQRIAKYQQAAQTAMATDRWQAAKQQLELLLKEQAADKSAQQSLLTATQIINFNSEFDHHINNPYRLSNKSLASSVKSQIEEANALANNSPSLTNKANTLSLLIEKMNKTIPVQVISDNQTHILVRGVGVVGLTQSKTIQLSPGRYRFEGKRKGYKSKLLDVLISYDDTSYQINILCDEPI
ncbi:hypothetical protein A9Q78_09780 [Methylophaga sp. 41_12_T18]|nr:hypothetical protein A9Q78_09780 [Methylophaga sp. 41_12_T18]